MDLQCDRRAFLLAAHSGALPHTIASNSFMRTMYLRSAAVDTTRALKYLVPWSRGFMSRGLAIVLQDSGRSACVLTEDLLASVFEADHRSVFSMCASQSPPWKVAGTLAVRRPRPERVHCADRYDNSRLRNRPHRPLARVGLNDLFELC